MSLSVERGSNPEQSEKLDVGQEIERFCANRAIDQGRPGAFALETNLDNNKVDIKILDKKFSGAEQNDVLAKFLKRTNDGYDYRGNDKSFGYEEADSKQAAEQFEQFVQDELTTETAGVLHDEWRRPRWRKETGDYEPRLKPTKDQAWIDAHGQNQVDIANTNYEDLPADWQAENKASASVAVREVLKVLRGNRGMEVAFVASKAEDHYEKPDYGVKGIKKAVENISDTVHQEWLKRNGEWAPAEQKKDYEDLSEEEQEKDRAIVRTALEICAGREKEISASKNKKQK